MKALSFLLAWLSVLLTELVGARAGEPIEIGSRLELLVDGYWIESLSGGAEQRLHHPVAREVALVVNEPWEGNRPGYVTVFQDGDRYRMYYRASNFILRDGRWTSEWQRTCYAESQDGIHWTKPKLGLFEVGGTRDNNVILTSEVAGTATHNFCPFRDPRPDIPEAERYKAFGGTGRGRGVWAFVSADGIRWKKLREKQVITTGAFDSQNLAFWDAERNEYRAYIRDFREGRDIRTCTSPDFIHWSEPEFIEYVPRRVSELYTNQIQPYYRAPHILLGFPTRYVERPWQAATEFLPFPEERRRLFETQTSRLGTAVTDGMFMSSRDRHTFAIWPESFHRPGPGTGWFYGHGYQAWGLVETKSAIEGAPNELSMYFTESRPGLARVLRRYTLRIDGFVSVWAPLAGGELLTRPLIFQGRQLVINYATSAAGSLRMEIQEADGTPIPGFTLADAEELFGDSLAQPVLWKHGPDVTQLAGRPVRLRFVLSDADVFSFQFHR